MPIDWIRPLRSLLGRDKLDITWITPEWAVGAAPTPKQLGAYARAGITSILDVRAEAQLDPTAFTRHGFHLYHIPIRDRAAPTMVQFRQGTDWVLGEIAAGRRALICCHAGSGRSVTMSCALLSVMGYSPAETLAIVSKRRAAARPTEPQLLALRTFVEAYTPTLHAPFRTTPY